MFASGFFASEPKGHTRKFRMVCDSRRGYLFRSRRAVLAIKFSPHAWANPPRKVNPSVLDQFSIPHSSRGEISPFGERHLASVRHHAERQTPDLPRSQYDYRPSTSVKTRV